LSPKLKEENISELNLLDIIPVHNTKWKQDSKGQVILFKPKFKNPLFVKYILPHMKRPYYKITLDDIGSFFWKNCNGSRSVKKIAELQKERFGDKVAPLYDRIATFLQTLERNGFLKLS
jgi:hypothetical protein